MLFIGGDVMADDFIQDDFIQIPSFLNENTNIDNEIISPMATCDGSCMDWCEHYDECCQYENCMGACETCQTGCEISCQNCEGVACQTSQAPTNPAENATLTVIGVGETSFAIRLSGLSNPTGIPLNIYFYLDNVFQRMEVTASNPILEHYYTQLDDGTNYTAKVVIEGVTNGTIYKTLTKTVTTDTATLPKLPTPTLDTNATIKTANSITVTINAVTGATTYYARIGGGTAQTSSGRTFAFYDLTPNTQYYIEIKVGGSGYRDSNWAGYYATTLATAAWEWWYPKDDIRRFTLDRDEWLAFCNKINEVRVANGLSAYSFTTSSTYIGKDKPFYAWIWLEAANAINAINGQVAAACLNVKSWSESQDNDSIIYPWYWDNLKSALNNAI